MPSDLATNKTVLLSTLDWSRLSFLLGPKTTKTTSGLCPLCCVIPGVKVSVVGRGEDAVELVKATAPKK